MGASGKKLSISILRNVDELITVERETVNVRSKPKEEPSAKKSPIWSYKRDESGGTLVNPRPGQESFECTQKRLTSRVIPIPIISIRII